MAHEDRIKHVIAELQRFAKAIAEPIPGVVDTTALDAWRGAVGNVIHSIAALAIEVAQERHDCGAYFDLLATSNGTAARDRAADGSGAGKARTRRGRAKHEAAQR